MISSGGAGGILLNSVVDLSGDKNKSLNNSPSNKYRLSIQSILLRTDYMGKMLLISIFCTALIVFQGLISYSWAQPIAPIIINAKPELTKIDEGDNLLVNVELTNIGKFIAQGMDVQIVSPGFKITVQKNWSSKLYPGSTISGQYILESIGGGNFPIYISASYLINDTSTTPPQIRQMVSNFSTANVVVTEKSEPLIGWNSLGEGTISTAIGLALGLIVPKIAEAISSIGSEKRERLQRFERLKSLLEYELQTDKRYIERLDFAEIERWRKIADENLYSLLSENPTLEEKLLNLYANIGSYNIANQNERNGMKNGLLATIVEIIDELRAWKIT